jgi:hypothetical protein
MSFSAQAIKSFLKKGEIRKLFIEGLGWDGGKSTKDCKVDDVTYGLKEVAVKAGFKVWLCEMPGQKLPTREETKAVHRQLVKESYEHIIIFASKDSKSQAWLWVRREANKPISYKHHLFSVDQDGESLSQKLRALYIAFEEEEEGVDIVDVTKRAKKAFDVEKVTKKFYQEFDKHRKVFLGFIDGIPVESDREWYASVMLNRLMFAYFIQKKGFLDSNPDYLKSKLKECQAKKGEDKFYSFYRIFLLRLFHEGLGMKKLNRPKGLDGLLGNIPYLNGGMFDVHELEKPENYGRTIEIKDEAFEKVFAYFDQYQWHLDERPLKNDKEINPDVLGYIFEKYINQKQMGAYYTKEDITEYISKSTIIPFIFDSAKALYPGPFESANSPVWSVLKTEPEDFIYKALKHGIEHNLPALIDYGVDAEGPRLIERRNGWNKIAPQEFALVNETWREVVERRKRYMELKRVMLAGEVRSIDQLVSLNLDIRQFALEVVDGSEDPELIWAIWRSITKISVLDPTGGSGAFLFAALNILEPIYEACLERISSLLMKNGDFARRNEFEEVLVGVNSHSNRKYFILKSIILNNLYAVDIMEEAVEICKLRLFLKLASQVEPDVTKENFGIEPLPDIDFNICAGNSLIGYATYEEARDAVTNSLDFDNVAEAISIKAEELDLAFASFRRIQVSGEGSIVLSQKLALQEKLRALEQELNRHVAQGYGINFENRTMFEKWENTHQPFHWFLRFYGIIKSGGFNVIVGNPPYLDLKQLKEYALYNYKTLPTKNLYSLVLERCDKIVNGRQGYIVPISSIATEGYAELQSIITKRRLWVSSFDDRPAHLFDGLDKNTLSILLLSEKRNDHAIESSKLNRWSAEERSELFQKLRLYNSPVSTIPGCLPRISSLIEHNIWQKLFSRPQSLASSFTEYGVHRTFYSRKVNSFLQILNFTPIVKDGRGDVRPPSEFKEMKFSQENEALAVFCTLNSSLFRWFMDIVSDGSHLNRRETDLFPFDPRNLGILSPRLASLGKRLSKDLRKNSFTRKMVYAHDTLTVQCIAPKFSKAIIDEIDAVVASYYGFNDEELDFIINYDIKYRLGRADEMI